MKEMKSTRSNLKIPEEQHVNTVSLCIFLFFPHAAEQAATGLAVSFTIFDSRVVRFDWTGLWKVEVWCYRELISTFELVKWTKFHLNKFR